MLVRLSTFFGIHLLAVITAQALTISEIMSNPVGDDAGREWVEVYNESDGPIDIATLSISIKGGNPISTVSLQGGTVIPSGGYAIVSSIVSASSPVSKFLEPSIGYPDYAGVLVRVVTSASFVNTGTTSLDIRLGGSVVDSLSYTPGGEGKTFSRVNGVFVTGTPTPGASNQASVSTSNTSSANESQVTLAQTSPPAPDIILYLPESRLVVAGAETDFSVYGMTRAGQTIENMTATWAFGDGGQAIGTTTSYAYAYPGKYRARVDAGNSSVRGVGTMDISVVAPEVRIASYGTGKYGAYVDIENPNEYDLDVSQWRIHIGYGTYTFPKHTIIPQRSTTRIAGKAMGFEKTSFNEGTQIRITFPNLEEVTRFVVLSGTSTERATIEKANAPERKIVQQKIIKKEALVPKATTTGIATSGVRQTKDTRLISWFKSRFRG